MPTRAKMTIWTLFQYDSDIFKDFYVPEGVVPDPDATPPVPGYDPMDKSAAVFTILNTCGDLEVMYPDPEYMQAAIANWSYINAKKWQRLWDSENLVYNPIYNVDATEIEDHDLTYTRDDKGKYAGFNSATLNAVNQADDTDTDKGTITKTRYGNIGTTMAQQMIEADRQVADFSTYRVIAEDFKKEFCVMVY